MKKCKKSIALLLAVVSLLAICLGGCGGSGNASETVASATGTASQDSSIILAQTSEVANLNPMIQPRTPDSNAQCLIFSFPHPEIEDLSRAKAEA